MRTFCSQGQLNTNFHYYAPSDKLIDKILNQLKGEITLVLFTEYINDQAIEKYEVDYIDQET